MQRWIVPAVIAVVVLGLATAAAGYAWWNHRQNQETRVWVPLQLNAELPEEKRELAAIELKRQLSEAEVLTAVAKDSGFTRAMEFSSDTEAADFLRERLFVEVGERDVGMGLVPTLNVGFKCKVREYKEVEMASQRMMKDVWRVVGAKNPPSAPPEPSY